ncbi:hypothetical protein QR680_003372 [Steinernema hermaphroditum]|uniref:Cell cycle control protein 50A n=1 Tax=Steinernema hermaphroditum TaxID=289476 RepID=A0AA39H7G9_9BILA|nr:hypothetical protein QR680_003372 [Steinernema hermaphroditum]
MINNVPDDLQKIHRGKRNKPPGLLMGDVVFFYGLSNFYQNLRQYIASRNDQQLFGDLESVENCAPYEKDETSGLKIAPCGSVANSMFNDTFSMTYSMENGTTVNVPFAAGNVIHSYERERKYKNPPYDPALNETLCDAFNKTTQPPWWQTPICEVGNDETGRGFENVDFIVWMNTAPLPDFRKIYRTLNRTQPDDSTFHIGLPAGNYTLRIRYNYGVAQFNIKKYFVIATTSWSGPKNFFLGIAYMTVGLFLFLLGCGLIVYECINRKMNVMADSAPQVTNDAEREPDALEHSEQILTPKRRSPTPERKSCKRPKKSILSGARAEIPHKRRSKQPVESGQHATDPSELNETCEVHELTDNVEPTPKSTRTFDCYQNVLLPSQMPEFEKNHINNIAKIVFPSALRNVKENDKAHGSNGKSSMVDHLPEDVRKLVDAERNAAIAASSCAIPLPGQEFVTRLFISTGTVQNALFPPQNAAGLLNMFNAFRNGSAHMRWLQYMMATGNPQPVAVPAGESALFPNCINCLSSPATSASQKTSAFPFREQQKYVFKCSFCKETIFNLKPGLYEIRQHVANHHGLFISCIFKKCTIRSQLREFGGHIHKVHGKKTAELKGDEALLYQAKRDVFKYDTNVLLLRYMDMPPNSVRNMDLLPPTEAKRALAQTAL